MQNNEGGIAMKLSSSKSMKTLTRLKNNKTRTKDNERQAKEREPLPPPKGYEREDFVGPYQDIPIKGVLYYLQNYEAMTTDLLSRMMLYGIRRINDVIILLNKRFDKDAIEHISNATINKDGKQRTFKVYRLNKMWKNIHIDNLYSIVLNNMSKNSTNMDINQSEKYVEEILKDLAKDWFKFVGVDKSYKISGLTPDFVDEKRGLIVEFNGHHHDPCNTVESTYDLHVLNRKQKYASFGWKLFPIRHTDIHGNAAEKEMKKLLSDFLDENKDRDHAAIYEVLLKGSREVKKEIILEIVHAI